MVIAGVILGVLAILTVFLVEWLKKPKLSIIIKGKESVWISNRELPRYLRKVLSRTVARSCQAEASLQISENESSVWQLTLIPVRHHTDSITGNHHYIIDSRDGTEVLDIGVGEDAAIPVFERKDGDTLCQIAGRDLQFGEYNLEIKAKCANSAYTQKKLLLRNLSDNSELSALQKTRRK